ncbi:MAG: MFS transporter [Ornithinimicrobium sp.]|uniref:MFS transporter n=1 Tax=Ornithinimicrobium sp. TaxID=1977084 RepID=UPI003D9ACBB6
MTTGRRAGPEPTAEADRDSDADVRRGLVLTVLVVPLFMALMGVSIVNVSLPAIQEGLGASTAQLQWVLSGYSLTFGLLLVPAGRLGDVFGRRTLFLAGVSLFVLASAASALAPSPTLLNVARLVMGVGSGLFNPQIVGMIQQYFSGAARARAFGVIGSFIGLALATGPLLGGVILQTLGPDLGWRMVFGVNVPVGLLAVVLALRWLPRPVHAERPHGRVDLDPLGIVVFGAAVLLVMAPFLQVSDSLWRFAALPLSALVLWGWVRWERRYRRRGGEPMIDVRIFADRGFAYGTSVVTIYFLGLTPSWAVLALYVQQGLGRSALVAGLLTLPGALAASVTSVLGGRLVTRLGRPMVAAGAAVAALGQLGTGLLAPWVDDGRVGLWAMAATFLVTGAAQGFVIGPNQSLTLADVPVEHGGAAGGVMQTGQRIGGAVGIAVGTGVLYAVLADSDWPTAVLVSFVVMAAATSICVVVALLDARRRAR